MRMKKSLHVRGSSHRVTLSAVSLLLLGAGGLLLPIGQAQATYCDSNLQYSLSGVPDGEINLSGKKNGDVLFTVLFTHVRGVCRPPVLQNGMDLFVTALNPSGNSCSGGNAGRTWDRLGAVEMWCRTGNAWIGGEVPRLSTSMVIRGGHTPIYLKDKTKIIGRTTISMGDFYSAAPQFWSQNHYVGSFQSESGSLVGDINKTITLINTPTCSASVNDVTFPSTPTPSAIATDIVTPQTATVSVTCDDILPKYTIKVSSPNGTQGSATDGVIKSNNPTVGYRLSWEEGQVATTGSNIQLDSVLTPATLPTQSTFTLPISVKPVALVPQGSIMAGPANSAIKIDLTFN